VSVSSVFRHPESDAPAFDHKSVAPGPRPAPRVPRPAAHGRGASGASGERL